MLREHVNKHINGQKERLQGLCQYIQANIKFLPLEVASEGEGYLVFDTTNTRGMRLSPSEALKGRLATIAREDSDLSAELIKRWDTAAMKLEGADLRIDAMDDYLHALWCSKEGYTAKKTLDRIAEKMRIEELGNFVRDLDSYCASYLAVVNPTGESQLTEDLKDMKSLIVQAKGFLTMVHKHAFHRFEEAVDLVLSLQIRNVTVGPYQPHEYEKNWPNWAMLVRKGSTDEAFKDIRSRMVSDKDFQRRLEGEPVVSMGTARHLLRRLDPISRPGSGVQPVNVDVEHVLPKSVVTKLIKGKKLTTNVQQWIKDLGYEVPNTPDEKYVLGIRLQKLLNMLGNQALLNIKANRGAKDLPFPKKKDFYRKQALELTKALAVNGKWGESEVLARQKEMAKIAPSVWRK